MIAKIKQFFDPENEAQLLRRVVAVLSFAIAIVFVSVLAVLVRTPEPGRTQVQVELFVFGDYILAVAPKGRADASWQKANQKN
jgi:hypothetical protein